VSAPPRRSCPSSTAWSTATPPSPGSPCPGTRRPCTSASRSRPSSARRCCPTGPPGSTWWARAPRRPRWRCSRSRTPCAPPRRRHWPDASVQPVQAPVEEASPALLGRVREHVLRRAPFDHPAAVEEQHLVGPLPRERQLVRHHHHGPALGGEVLHHRE